MNATTIWFSGLYDKVDVAARATIFGIDGTTVNAASTAFDQYLNLKGISYASLLETRASRDDAPALDQQTSAMVRFRAANVLDVMRFAIEVSGVDDQTVRCILALNWISKWYDAVVSTEELETALQVLHVRPPTPTEELRISVLSDAHEHLEGTFHSSRTCRVFHPTLAMPDLRGHLQARTIYLANEQLRGSFHAAFAAFLREAARVDDGGPWKFPSPRGVESLVRFGASLGRYERQWNDLPSGGEHGALTPRDGADGATTRSAPTR